MKINNSPLSNINTSNKNVAFGGKIPGVNTAKKLFEPLASGAMSRELFVVNAFIFLLGGRIFASRDGNEKRETIIRDIPTILLAVAGVPGFKKFIAKKLNDKTGIAIGQKIPFEAPENPTLTDKAKTWVQKTFMKGKAPKDSFSMASGAQLKNWYIFDELTEKSVGFDGFMDRFNKIGANAKSVISSLSEEIKSSISGFSSENKAFMTELNANSDLKNKIIEAFKNPQNKAFEKANWFKTIPNIIGFAGTLLLIGWFIPKTNIKITETINKNKAAKTDAQPQKEEPVVEVQGAQLKAIQNLASKENKKAFASFSGEGK